MVNIALNLLTGIVIATVSAWITVQLSLRRFRAEKWWERKADAYSKVIEALHNSKTSADHFLVAEIRGLKLPEDRDEEMRSRMRAAKDEILKAMDVGSFVLSKEALDRLRQYKRDTDEALKQNSLFEYLETNVTAAERCLNDIIEISKRDLRTK